MHSQPQREPKTLESLSKDKSPNIKHNRKIKLSKWPSSISYYNVMLDFYKARHCKPHQQHLPSTLPIEKSPIKPARNEYGPRQSIKMHTSESNSSITCIETPIHNSYSGATSYLANDCHQYTTHGGRGTKAMQRQVRSKHILNAKYNLRYKNNTGIS